MLGKHSVTKFPPSPSAYWMASEGSSLSRNVFLGLVVELVVTAEAVVGLLVEVVMAEAVVGLVVVMGGGGG